MSDAATTEKTTVSVEKAPETTTTETVAKKERTKKEKKEKAPAAAAAVVASDDKVTFDAHKEDNFPLWYEQILIAADVLDKRYPVKGMPVFKGYGYYMHNAIMNLLEQKWEEQGIDKVQFPTVIPEQFLRREENHLEGFKAECFWVTQGGNDPLEVQLALRPTSETAMYSMFSLWIRSFRDLPLKVHQTCQVFRYETKDTLPLIRVREIYWNEAHTAHATAEDALDNLEKAWDAYLYLIRDCLGVFGLRLRRPIWDKFAGADHTDVMDAVLPSGKVLQIVGAHYLGQRFAKVFDIKFLNQKNEFEEAYMTCYGVSTRILASALSQHGDNKGLVLPPAIAKFQVVIVPIIMKKADSSPIEKAKEYQKLLQAAGIRCTVDDAEKKPGEKYYYWEMKGVPLRMEIGPRDVQNNQVTIVRRDNGEKSTHSADGLVDSVKGLLDGLFANIKTKSQTDFEANITTCSTMEEVAATMLKGGFARIPFHSMDTDGRDADRIIHEKTGGEVRGHIPGEAAPAEGTLCLVTGKPAKFWGYVARSY